LLDPASPVPASEALLRARPPPTRKTLRLGNLSGVHSGGDSIARSGILLSIIWTSVCCREIHPYMRLNVVLGHAVAVVVHHSKVVLPPSIALVGGLAVPLGRLDIVLDHALPEGV
jgi:hypothetical protein